MSPRRIRLAASAATLCFAYVAVPGTSSAAWADRMHLTSGSRAALTFTIAVAGKRAGSMYPGITRDLNIELANPYGFAIVVRSLRGEVVSSSRAKCRPVPGNLVARPHVGRLPLTVPAGARVRAGVIPLDMPWSASRHCAQAEFTVRLTGTASKAAR
jgi:hypothetical protein